MIDWQSGWLVDWQAGRQMVRVVRVVARQFAEHRQPGSQSPLSGWPGSSCCTGPRIYYSTVTTSQIPAARYSRFANQRCPKNAQTSSILPQTAPLNRSCSDWIVVLPIE